MHHAVGAFLVVSSAVGIPIGRCHQPLGVAFTDEVARTLPAEHRTGRIAPRRAVIALVAGEKVEEQPRLTERPVSRATSAAEDAAEQLLRLLAVEKMLLVRSALIGV